jgi:hypothetical protein
MSRTFIRSAAGAALLAVLAAGCGTAVTARRDPASPFGMIPTTTAPPATATATSSRPAGT